MINILYISKCLTRTADFQVRDWNSKLRKQTYLLDRQIRNIQREEAKVKAAIKQNAKRGDRDSLVILAKELVRSKKAIGRIHTSKAQINSVMMHMNNQLSNLKVMGAMEKSANVMKSMQNLVKVAEISEAMQELSREMMKAGILDEMLEETLEDVTDMDDEELDEEVQAEVDKILSELTAGICCESILNIKLIRLFKWI